MTTKNTHNGTRLNLSDPPASSITVSSNIGIVAGNGAFPRKLAAKLSASGFPPVIFAIKDEADPELHKFSSSIYWFRLGQLGRLLSLIRRSGVEQVVFLGGVNRAASLRRFVPDLKGLLFLIRQVQRSDDSLLRAVASEVERLGVKVCGGSDLLPELLFSSDDFSDTLTPDQLISAEYGWRALYELGRLDIGQALVVKGRTVIGVEGVEGTDALIERCGVLAGSGAMLIKRSKPNQDLRLDLPSIGLHTIELLAKYKYSALVIEEGRVQILEPDLIRAYAKRSKISVVGMSDKS